MSSCSGMLAAYSTCALLCACALVSCTAAMQQADADFLQLGAGEQRLCGRRLARALMVLCYEREWSEGTEPPPTTGMLAAYSTCALLCACALVSCTAAMQQADADFLQLGAGEQRLCGRRLARALMVLCYEREWSEGTEPPPTTEAPALRPATDTQPEDSEGLPAMWRRARLVRSAGPSRGEMGPAGRAESRVQLGSRGSSHSRRKREGLVSECCFRPCTVDMLLEYC